MQRFMSGKFGFQNVPWNASLWDRVQTVVMNTRQRVFDDRTVDTSRAASLFSVTCGSMNPIPLHPKMPWWRFCVMEFKLYISGKIPVFLEKVEKSEMTPEEEQNDVRKLDVVRHGAGRNLRQGIGLAKLSLAG